MDFLITLFSAYYVIIFMASIAIGIGLGFLSKKMPSKVLLTLLSIFSLIPTLFLILVIFLNPSTSKYGYSLEDFEVAGQNNNVLCLKNSYSMSGGGYGTTVDYRIQGLDLEDGKKLYFKHFSNCKVLGDTNNILWISTNDENLDVVGMDIKTGKKRIPLTEKFAKQQYSALSSGIHSWKYNKKASLFSFVSQTGNELIVDVTTDKKVDTLKDGSENTHFIVDKYSIEDVYQERQNVLAERLYQQQIEHSRYSQEEFKRPDIPNPIILSLKGEFQKKLFDQNEKQISDILFLKGKFVLFDTTLHNSIILNYETLDKKEINFICVTMEGKVLWKVIPGKLKVFDFFNSDPDFISSFYYKEAVIFVLDGFVFSVNKLSGQLNWLTRL